MDIWEQDPVYTNQEGTKWWDDDETTRYARQKTLKGKSLPLARGYFVETIDGYRTRVLIDEGVIVAESQQLEGLGVKIDLLKFLED